jgi:hypothetical protein
MVRKSFDAIYASASKVATRRHSIMLSRGAVTLKFAPAAPRPKGASKRKASPKTSG